MQALRPFWETTAGYTLRTSPSAIERAMGHTAGVITGEHYDRPRCADYVEPIAMAYSRNPWADT